MKAINPILFRIIAMTVLWLLLAGFSNDAWVIAVPFILLAVWSGFSLAPATPVRFCRRAIPGFLLYIVVEMLRGGFLTAGVALWPGKRLRPGLVTLPLHLSTTAARVFFLNVLNLVPGTLSVEIKDDAVILHVLDVRTAVADESMRLERHVAKLFGEVER